MSGKEADMYCRRVFFFESVGNGPQGSFAALFLLGCTMPGDVSVVVYEINTALELLGVLAKVVMSA